MKNITTIVNALKAETAIKAVPEVIIDWNMNRYVGAVAENTPTDFAEGFDVELFPIESIVENNRPLKGINKARVGMATISDDYLSATTSANQGRFYIADVDDTYKYWTSPVPSDASTAALTKTKPQVVYNSALSANKINLVVENTWASPLTFSIQTTTSAAPADTDWTEIANQTTVGNDWKGPGKIELYWNGSAWVTTGRVDNADKTPKMKSLRGVRMVVTALEGGYGATEKGQPVVRTTYKLPAAGGDYTTFTTDGKDAHFDLIEISANLEVDLSDQVITIGDTFELAAASSLYPIGTVTTNQGSLTLSNLYQSGGEWVTGLFSADNAASPYRNFIEPNAKVVTSYNYYDDSDVFLGKVKQFTMYTETWGGQSEDSVVVELSDYSKFFDTDEVKLRSAMWENLTVPEIVWRVLDSIGFSQYQVDRDSDKVTEHVIPVFYTDSESTVWETLDELAQASQTAIYFDKDNILQVKTRDFALSSTDAPVWDFTSETVGARLSDIVTLSVNTEFEPNKYTVVYQKTNWSNVKRGQPVLQVVWEPEEEAVVLRASALKRNMDTTSNRLWLGQDDARYWPYSGLVNLDGEIMRFDGKEYIYYTGPLETDKNTLIIKTQDDYASKNEKTPLEYRHKNKFSGAMVITKRGEWNTEVKPHTTEAASTTNGGDYSVRQIVKGTPASGVSGFYHNKETSRVQLMSGAGAKDGKDIKLATIGGPADQTYFNYGTRFRFLKESGRTTQRAGIVISNSGTQEAGYYIDVTPSKNVKVKKKAATKAVSRQEVVLIARTAGKDVIVAQAPAAIGENIDYELDVSFSTSNGHSVKVWLNGKMIINEDIKAANKADTSGRFGMFVRGKTRAEFEYLYAIRRDEEPPLPEDFSFLDKVERGYTGNQWDREWVYEWQKSTRKQKKESGRERYRKTRTFFDEFGAIAHEVREYDVKFDPAPVLNSRLYMSNDWSAVCLEYRASPFGAQFILANTSRRNAVLNGEDKLSFSGTDNAIEQVLTVFGRALVVEENEEVEAKNEDQIRRRGKNEAEITNPWIQSKGMAQDLAKWMKDNFSYGNDNISIEVFGNPLVEIGDIVTVSYPDKHIIGSFFVYAVTNNFDRGLSTTLSLRRRAV